MLTELGPDYNNKTNKEENVNKFDFIHIYKLVHGTSLKIIQRISASPQPLHLAGNKYCISIKALPDLS